ncbi:hypothetical protein DRQ05_00835, partial [bacterium]
MITFTDENKRLFSEQVADHIEKLNDLMGMSSGAHFEESPIERANLATKLLEGSTRMLGLDSWSKTLTMLRELLEGALRDGRVWDDKLSQIVSEILETEEQMVAEILTGEIDSINNSDHFSGLQREIEYLGNEEFSSGQVHDTPRVETHEEGVRLEKNEGQRHGGFVTIDTIASSLERLQSNLEDFVISGSVDDELIESTDVSFGRIEFGVEMLGNILKRFRNGKLRFHPTVPAGNIVEALDDFFNIYNDAEQWNAKLMCEVDDFNIDDRFAKVLASVLEGFIYDIGGMYKGRDDVKLSIYMNIRSSGSYCTVSFRDNAPDFLKDSRFDRPDPVSFYHSLRNIRALLEDVCGLLWIEPDIEGGERFRLSMPVTRDETDFTIFPVGSESFAVMSVVVDSVIPLSSEEIGIDEGRRH